MSSVTDFSETSTIKIIILYKVHSLLFKNLLTHGTNYDIILS